VGLMVIQETTMGNGTQPPPSGGGLATAATIVLIGLIVILVAVVCYKILTASAVPEGNRSWLDYGNFFIVALGILAVLLAFLVTMLFSGSLFENASQVLAVLTALFGVIGTLVGTYFGVKAGMRRGFRGAEPGQRGDLSHPARDPLGPAIARHFGHRSRYRTKSYLLQGYEPWHPHQVDLHARRTGIGQPGSRGRCSLRSTHHAGNPDPA
jgi:hypothetical protein